MSTEEPYWMEPAYRKHRAEYMRKWYSAHKKEQLAKCKEYNRVHPEVHRKASKKYREKHRKSRTPEQLRRTETWIGRKAELFALTLFPGAVDKNQTVMGNEGHDFEWRNLTFDVKSSNGFVLKNGYFQWSFGAHGKYASPDFFLCIGYKDGIVQRVYLIPAQLYSKVGVTIGFPSKKWKNFELSFS